MSSIGSNPVLPAPAGSPAESPESTWEAAGPTTATPAEPCYFGPSDRPIFGQLHRSPDRSDRAPGLGLVICNPFGYEAICAHRSLRRFAEDAAALGIPAIRFDYDGTGDSFGDSVDPDRVQSWVRSIHDAITQLIAVCGTERVVLLGVRLGATLATLAATERSDIAGIVAVAPVVSGKAYLRELRALQMALGLAPPPAAMPAGATSEGPGGMAAALARGAEGEQESVGFAITPETGRGLREVDLTKASRGPAPEVLIIDRNDLPANTAWVDALLSHGTTVAHRILPGYVEMVLDPHKARAPEVIHAATRGWLIERRDDPKVGAPTSRVGRTGGAFTAFPRAIDQTAVMARDADGTPAVTEEAGYVGHEAMLFGVTTRPAKRPGSATTHDGPSPGLGILLLNAGAIHHTGPSRLYVTLARAWAAEGHTVLRLDLSGLGDSGTRPGQPENIVYSEHAATDVSTAIRELRARSGGVGIVIVGLCSGAYHGFKAAVAGEPVSAVVPINPLTFFWKEGMPLDFPAHKVAGESRRYARSALRLASWKKLVRGDVNLQVLSQILARRALSLMEHRWRNVARTIGLPLHDDLGRELESVARRGIAIDFVFAEGEPGLDLLALQGGSVVPRLTSQGRLRSHMISGPDHTFTPRWSHLVLIDRLTALIRSHSQAASNPGQGHDRGRGRPHA